MAKTPKQIAAEKAVEASASELIWGYTGKAKPKNVTPQEPVQPTVVKTDAMQARIDARNNAVQPTPEEKVVEDTAGSWLWSSTGVVQPKTEPVTTETTPEPVVTPEPVNTEPTEPVKTPEGAAVIDAQTAQAEKDKAKAEAEAAALAAKEAEAANKWEVVPLTQDEAFATLQSGGKLDNSKESAVFKNRWNAYQKINGMPSSSIADLNANGDIAPSLLDSLAKLNPTKYAEVVKLTDDKIKVNNINQSSERLFNKANGKTVVPEKKKSETAMENFIANYQKSDAVTKALIDNLTDWEMSDMVTDIAEKDARIEETQDEIDMVYDDLRGQFPTLPKSMLMGMASAATKDMNRSLNTLIRERNVAFSTYNAKKDDIETQIKYSQENMKNSMDFLGKIYDTTKMEEVRQEDFVRADKLLSDQIAREDKKDEQRIKELEQTRMDNMKWNVSQLGGDPTKFNTYEWLLQEAGKLSKEKIANELAIQNYNAYTNRINATDPSASDWIDVKWFDKDWNEVTKKVNIKTKEELSYNDYADRIWNKPTGKYVSVNTGNKNVQVDEVAAGWLTQAMQEMKDAWIYVLTGEAKRNQAEAIKAMWERVGMPWATASELRKAGHQIADVWSSKHEWGMAIDLYSDDSFSAPTAQQIEIMEKNGWKHIGIKWDMGHFEYQWTQQENPYESFVDTIAGSLSLTAQSKKDLKKSLRDSTDPWAVIRNRAKDIMGQTSATELWALERARDIFNDFTNDLAEFYAKWGKSGIFEWKEEDIRSSLWNVWDPALRAIGTKILGNIQAYRKAISGTAFSVQEWKDIDKIFPWINKSKELNDVVAKARQELFDSNIDAGYRSVLRNDYDKLLQLEGKTGEQDLTGLDIINWMLNEWYNPSTKTWATSTWTKYKVIQ